MFVFGVITFASTTLHAIDNNLHKLHKICVDEKCGLIDGRGNLIVKPIFDSIDGSISDSETIWAVKNNQKCGYIGYKNGKGYVIAELIYDRCGNFWEGYADVRIDNKYNYIDLSGNHLGQSNFEGAKRFSEGVAAIKRNGKYYFIDKSSKMLFDVGFEDTRPFFEGLAAVKVGGKYGFINKKGSYVVKPIYENAYDFSYGRAKVVLDDKEYLIDKEGRILFKPEYDHIDPGYYTNSNVISVSKNGTHGLINMHGQWVVKPEYRDSIYFSEGLGTVHLADGRTAVIDERGQFVISPTHLYIYNFNEGLAEAQLKENGVWKSGFIDRTGKFVIPAIYEDVGYFYGGIAPVKYKDFYLYIDKNGKEVWRGSAKDFSPYH
jgi:hypothetical protein